MVGFKEGMSIPGAPSPPWWKDALLTLGCLLLVLGFLFRESFESDKVVFANDAPLGAIQAHAYDEKDGWSYWQDLNWIGGEFPSAMPNFTKVFFELCLIAAGENGAVLFAKWYQPISLVLLGFCAWLFFRSLRFRQPVCLLGGLAAALNGDFFTYACWGLPSVALGAAGAFLAMSGIINALRERGVRMIGWVILGGLGLGQGIDDPRHSEKRPCRAQRHARQTPAGVSKKITIQCCGQSTQQANRLTKPQRPKKEPGTKTEQDK
jgi:hypothetical protein